jgi:hypothetical protein
MPAGSALGDRLATALQLLLAADAAAESSKRDRWQFAVETQEFVDAGVLKTDLRWLVSMGYAEHGQERTRKSSRRRSFRRLTSLSFPPNTCFVISNKGRRWAGRATSGERPSAAASPNPPLNGGSRASDHPRWDAELRQLRFNGAIIKQFRVPAPNQETILAALEEEGWPQRIDDPLPQSAEVNPRSRLHETIRALNRHQANPLLYFRGDGTGKGVLWFVSLQQALPQISPRSHLDHPLPGPHDVHGTAPKRGTRELRAPNRRGE